MDEINVSQIDEASPEQTPAEEIDHAPQWTVAVKADESLALAAAQHRSSAKPLKQRVRIFGIPLPIGGVSWVTSVLVHAALIWIGVTVYRHFIRPPQLQLALGDGGANPVGIMWREQTPGGEGMPQLPAVDSTQTPAVESMGSVILKLESKEEPEPRMNAQASSYVGPNLLWGAPPPVGAGHSSSDVAGAPAEHRGNGPAPGAKPPQVRQGEGSGRGKSTGAGSGQLNGGQAGVPTGLANLKLPAPQYPEESSRRNEQGMVTLSVIVLSDGSVGNVTVVSAPPYPRLTESAIDAVRQVHFDRAYAGATLNIPYNFVLH